MSSRIDVKQESDGRWIAAAVDVPGAVADGNTREEAIEAVRTLSLRILALRLAGSEPREVRRFTTKARKYALLWAAIYLVAMLFIDVIMLGRGLGPPFAKLVLLLFPLGLIYFSDSLGAFRGPTMRMHYVDTPTPGLAFVAFGWVAFGGILLWDLCRWLG